MITFSIDKISNTELNSLAEETNLQEPIDYFCNFIVSRDKGKLVAVAGVNFLRYRVPQFEHIIIAPKHQKTKLLVVIMGKLEEYIKGKGHKGYISFILNKNKYMQDYAIKWGMKAYDIKSTGIWFEKKIGG